MEDKGAAVDYGYSSRGGSATDQNNRESYIFSSQDSRHSPSSGSSADDNFSRNELFRVPDKWTWIFTLLSIAVVSLGGSLYRCFKGTGERVKAGLNPDDVKCCEAAGGADVAPQTPEVCTRAAPSPAPHPVKNDAPPVFGASAGGNTFSPPSVRRSFIPRLPVAKQPDMRLGGTAQVLRSPMQVERADDISCSRGPPPQERVSPPFTQCGMLRVTTPTSEEQRNPGPNPSDVLVNPFLQRWSR
ncbi:unnamed protein product [Trypanosoma congolense IL3000]|uniref:WGS project CAEQ00000000 data, annotated contig 1655 n=1 Tax=Trypanosoma congolense (strain IL3000) TaxID=1068625 RepID=F9W7U9_TRYCI|nr:unnamed protein product [Trypanosoma congolense IL3000]